MSATQVCWLVRWLGHASPLVGVLSIYCHPRTFTSWSFMRHKGDGVTSSALSARDVISNAIAADEPRGKPPGHAPISS